MEVNFTPNTFNPAAQADAEFAVVRQAADSVNQNELNAQRLNTVREVHEKVLMDLSDVQQFLYMLIGSDIKVASENERVGLKVNTVA